MKEQVELLDSKKIISAIAPGPRSLLSRLEIVDSIGSTNDYLLAQAKLSPSIASGTVCFAEQQTQGRGRQGKPWFSPHATNIYCSLIWNFPPSFTGLSALSIACAAMIIQALNNVGMVKGIELKWPNDILLSGRKLCGILLESLVSAQQNTVVIGIGLNLYLPAEKMQEWTSLTAALGQSISRNQMAGILLDEILRGISLFQAQGLNPFLTLCRRHDALFKKEVVMHTPLSQIAGKVQGIDDQGRLILLDQEGKEQYFCYGEVSVSQGV